MMKKQVIHLLKEEIIPDLKDHEFAQTNPHYANEQAEEIYSYFEEIYYETAGPTFQ